MDEPTVAAWVERYVRAWETNDPAAIGDLFAEHALYYPTPSPGAIGAKSSPAGSRARTSREPATSATRSSP
jgi:hypothetical protein